MKNKIIPYMSYWSQGYQKEPSDFVLKLHKLSIFFTRQIFGEVHLITDSTSLPFFENLNFDSITTELDVIDKDYGNVWSLGKLYAYKLIAERKKPFIHIDYDVFLLKPIDETILNADVFTQHHEVESYHWYNINGLKANCPNLHEIEPNPTVNAYNVGIFGGNDCEFIHEYAKSAIEFVLDPKNKEFWLQYDKMNWWQKACIAEQYYLASMIEKYNKNISLLFPKGWPKQHENDFYVHLMGAKTKNEVKNKIDNLFKKLKLYIEEQHLSQSKGMIIGKSHPSYYNSENYDGMGLNLLG